jgi:hypothetical protein
VYEHGNSVPGGHLHDGVDDGAVWEEVVEEGVELDSLEAVVRYGLVSLGCRVGFVGVHPHEPGELFRIFLYGFLGQGVGEGGHDGLLYAVTVHYAEEPLQVHGLTEDGELA